jgi:hypothetical protein
MTLDGQAHQQLVAIYAEYLSKKTPRVAACGYSWLAIARRHHADSLRRLLRLWLLEP